MNINIKIQLILLLFLYGSIFLSCEKKTNWNLKSSQKQIIIVDGIITNEYKNQTIKITQAFTDLNGSESFVEDAIVSVSDGNNVFNFYNDETSKGTYSSINKFSGVINKTYTLSINHKNKEYSATANMLPILISTPVPYKQVADTNLFYIASDLVSFTLNNAYMVEVILDWSEVETYENLPKSKTSAHLFFYKLTTIDVNQIFSPEHEIVKFPIGTKMTQKKYSLSPQHEEFIRSLLSETLWHGGYFDAEEGNVYTNIKGGALGFFGASSVVSRTVTVY